VRFRRNRTPKVVPNQEQMSLTEHLAELRMRIIRAALAIMIGMVVVLAMYDHVLNFVLGPYRSLCRSKPDDYCAGAYNRQTDTVSLAILDPVEGLATRFRVAFYGGMILALPVVLWQIWKFVTPALHKNERKYAVSFVLASVVLFGFGGLVAFYTLEAALEFLINWAGQDVQQVFRVSSYIRLVTLMIVAFGVGFIAPVLLVGLELIGVLTPRALLKAWRYALVAIFLISAVITPSGDPISLFALAVPMTVLYFLAILVGWLVLRSRHRRQAKEEEASNSPAAPESSASAARD